MLACTRGVGTMVVELWMSTAAIAQIADVVDVDFKELTSAGATKRRLGYFVEQLAGMSMLQAMSTSMSLITKAETSSLAEVGVGEG
jgi:hypothetical protein